MSDDFDSLKAALAARYAIERELGAGGMATVYLAHDVKHDRKVAVKVMRPELSAILGGERFLREIRTAAKLNHPHILPLFDSGKADSRTDVQADGPPTQFLYYVMPYVEGESLRDKLNREKQLGVDETIALTRQVASALDYAHEQGIVHRDIKPENILLHQGEALVADFGIALAVSAAGGTRLTDTGLSLGTPEYMSPEQATGERELDARSDVYSLGAVTYEMLVGEPPHTGKTVQAIIAKVVSAQPQPVSRVRHSVPMNVDHAVQCALAKVPADRFAGGAAFVEALTNPAFSLPSALGAVVTASPREGAWKLVAFSLAAVAVVLTVIAFRGWMREEPPRPVSKYLLGFPQGQEPVFDDPMGMVLGIAPDASWLLYKGRDDAGRLWVKPREQVGSMPIAGTEGATNAAISPDGERIAYVMGTELRVVRVAGGPSVEIADSVTAFGILGSWIDTASFVYVDFARRIRKASVRGGVPEILFVPEPNIPYVVAPSPLPGAKAVLFSVCAATCELNVLDLESGDLHLLPIDGGFLARYVPTGHLLIARLLGSAIVWSAIAFDPESLQLSGAEVPLYEGMIRFDFSINGTAVVLEGAWGFGIGQLEAVWVNREGVVAPVDPDWSFRLNSSSNYGWALSPDGTRLAIGLNTEYGNDIWIKELDGGAPSRFTFDETDDARPHWSDDGSSIFFVSNRAEPTTGDRRYAAGPDYYDLYEKRTDGTGQAMLRYSLESRGVVEAMVDEESGWIVMRAGGVGFSIGDRDIFAVHPGTDSTARPLLAEAYDEASVALSPDARWLAYTSRQSGRMEVYVRSFPNVEDGQWQISTGGGTSPLWAHSGRELFYVSSANEMTSVSVQTDPVFGVRQQQVLFSVGPEYVLEENYTVFDISSDDQRFVMVRRVRTEVESAPRLVLVENWFEELKQIMGENQ